MFLLNVLRIAILLLFIYCESNGFQVISSKYQPTPYRVTVTEEDDFFMKRTFTGVRPLQVEPNLFQRNGNKRGSRHKSHVHALVIAKLDENGMKMPDLLQEPFDPNEDRIPVILASSKKSNKDVESNQKLPRKPILSWNRPLDIEDKSEYNQKFFRAGAPYYGNTNTVRHSSASYPSPSDTPSRPAPSYLPPRPDSAYPSSRPNQSYPPTRPAPSYPPTDHMPQASPLYPPTSHMSSGFRDGFETHNINGSTSEPTSSHPRISFLPPSAVTQSFVSKLRELNDDTRIPVLIVSPKKPETARPTIDPRIMSRELSRPNEHPAQGPNEQMQRYVGNNREPYAGPTYSQQSNDIYNQPPVNNVDQALNQLHFDSHRMPLMWQNSPSATYYEPTIPVLTIRPKGIFSRNALRAFLSRYLY